MDDRLVVTIAIVIAGAVGAVVGGWFIARRSSDPFARYYVRRVVRFSAGVAVVLGLAMVWRPFAGRIGLVLGLTAAGLAFAMQEVLGALAAWGVILTSRVYRIGDRIEIGGLRGDVIDITPLRTKLLEIGDDAPDSQSWVRGRQPTGRLVSLSNKQIFEDPVFNFSAELELVWEEVTLPIHYHDDWRSAAAIMEEEAQRASADAADRQVRAFKRRYPVRRADITPRVFTHATDNYLEVSARFPVAVRSARTAKDRMTRRVLERFRCAGIDVASTTQDVTLRSEPGRRAAVEVDGSPPGSSG